jgi:hypothetical protein
MEAIMKPNSWADMLAMDPGLAEIDRMLHVLKGHIARGANRWHSYESAKSLLKARVGRFANPDSYFTDERSYEIGIRHIEKVLEL